MSCVHCLHDLIKLQTLRKEKTEELKEIDKKIDEVIDKQVLDAKKNS